MSLRNRDYLENVAGDGGGGVVPMTTHLSSLLVQEMCNP